MPTLAAYPGMMQRSDALDSSRETLGDRGADLRSGRRGHDSLVGGDVSRAPAAPRPLWRRIPVINRIPGRTPPSRRLPDALFPPPFQSSSTGSDVTPSLGCPRKIMA
jgi:hypothetical protein